MHDLRADNIEGWPCTLEQRGLAPDHDPEGALLSAGGSTAYWGIKKADSTVGELAADLAGLVRGQGRRVDNQTARMASTGNAFLPEGDRLQR